MTKIAIIEDDPVIAQMYRMKFDSEGFEVAVASNGEEGVGIVQAMKPDLILLDMQMPIMDGLEALTIIRSHHWGKKIPVLVLTNLGEEEAPKKIHLLDIAGYIVKADLTPRQVVERAKEVLKL
jgi:DNA-binding response OmpR family regulator